MIAVPPKNAQKKNAPRAVEKNYPVDSAEKHSKMPSK
jgi:hypothetical protein